MGIMEKMSEILNQNEEKKNNLSKAWNDLENHLELTQKCFQEIYAEQNSRENRLNDIQKSVTQSSNELETIRESIEKRLQEVERKENEFISLQANGVKEMEFMEEKMGLIRKEVKMREERMNEQEKLIERHLEEVEMERKRLEKMRNLVDEGVKEMSVKQKFIEDSMGNHESITKREKEIEMKEKKLMEMERELQLREKHLHSIYKSQSTPFQLSSDSSEETVEHARKLSEASGSNQRSGDRRPMSEALESSKDVGEKVKTNEKDDKNTSSADGRNEAMPKIDVGKPRESGEQRTKGRKREKQVEESSKSCDNSSDHIRKTKKQKGSGYPEGIPPMGKIQRTAGVMGTGPVKIGINDDSESDVAPDDKLETVVFEYPEPEFYDFDKDKEESRFVVDQIWACYDDVDGMPRFYVQIKKVFEPGFKLGITWLQADPEDQAGINWVNNELPFGCGRFRHGHNDDASVRLNFSHQMQCGKGKSRASFVIYPRKGEVWALFHDWDIKWSWNTAESKKFKYEIVEIVSDFVEDAGIRVAYLDKVEGFVSLFQRSNPSEMDSLLIPSNELLRFSHRIPSFTMSGTEKKGHKSVPKGSFELDAASLPSNHGDICHPWRIKEGSQSTDAGIGESHSHVDLSNSCRSPRGLRV